MTLRRSIVSMLPPQQPSEQHTYFRISDMHWELPCTGAPLARVQAHSYLPAAMRDVTGNALTDMYIVGALRLCMFRRAKQGA